MRILPYLYLTFLAFLQLSEGARKLESILLSNVKTLTLRKDQKTAHNRVAAVPQVIFFLHSSKSNHTYRYQILKLKCIGGNAKGLYDVDIMRCKNQGSDYDDENIQWTCSASLPPEFKLGSTDVICEGFASSSDPYVLKGSCGVEYRLILTTTGEEKYGSGSDSPWDGKGRSIWPTIIFWCIFISVIGLMIYSVFTNRRNVARDGGAANPWGGWGGGGGGGGADEPPPPYDYPPPPNTKGSSSRTGAAPAVQQGWRPGFWSGVLGGGAAGYMAGNRAQNQPIRNAGWFGGGNQQNYGSGWGNDWNSNGAGSSGWGGGARTRSSGSSNSPSSSARHESSGFGSTSRR